MLVKNWNLWMLKTLGLEYSVFCSCWASRFICFVFIRKDDDGWSEVRNACGVIGIVPSTYITQVVSKTVHSRPVNTSESTNDKSDSKPVLQRDRSYSVSVNNVPEPKLSTKHILRLQNSLIRIKGCLTF